MMITTFNEYQKEVIKLKTPLIKLLKTYPNLPKDLIKLIALSYDGLGLGEAGEVQGKIKKIIRDDGGNMTEEHVIEIKKEIGDILWYIASMCDTLGITIEDVATCNIEKLKSRYTRGVIHGSGDNR